MGSALLAAGLVVYNALANRWKPFHSWAYLPANVTLAIAVLAIGVWALGLDATTMGLRWASPWLGAAIGVAAIVPLGALLTFDRGRRLLRDRRLEDVRGMHAAYMIVVRIPIGTALVEELVFRGVLLGSFLHEGSSAAIAASSIVFGLWHLAPTVILARTNRLRPAVVPAGIAFTAAAGAFFGWLRVHTGSIASPFLVHALVNSLSACAAVLAHGLAGGVGGRPAPMR